MAQIDLTATCCTTASRFPTAVSLFSWLQARRNRRAQMKSLLEMTDAQLRDIGVSRAEAETEVRRLQGLNAIFPRVR